MAVFWDVAACTCTDISEVFTVSVIALMMEVASLSQT
jgi:hypothetical protein